jgi:hypothetical protein
MLREDQNRPHRITLDYIRRLIRNAKDTAFFGIKDRDADLAALDKAQTEHINAKTQFALLQSDATMINLIGTWARLTKIMRDMDDKYGSRE